jgi:hypothetical protein
LCTETECDLNESYLIKDTGKCVKCFCNNLFDVSCSGASHLYYNREIEAFKGIHHGWEVKELKTKATSVNVTTNTKAGEFEYTGEAGNWYFHAPSRFKGNRVRLS